MRSPVRALLLLALAVAGCGPAPVRDVPVPGAATRRGGEGAAAAVGAPGAPALQPPILPFDPATVAPRIDNPYFPLRPGTTLVYETRAAVGATPGTDTVTVRREPRRILGVGALVQVERSFRAGRLVAERSGAYVQDRSGNVWRLAGEERALGPDSTLRTVRAWEAGQDSAWAGVVMPGLPDVGMEFRPGWRRGAAEQVVRVENLNATAKTMGQVFTPCVVTVEPSAEARGSRVERYYAPGVGLVMQGTLPGGDASRMLTKIIVTP